jgi:hypothetical protein
MLFAARCSLRHRLHVRVKPDTFACGGQPTGRYRNNVGDYVAPISIVRRHALRINYSQDAAFFLSKDIADNTSD